MNRLSIWRLLDHISIVGAFVAFLALVYYLIHELGTSSKLFFSAVSLLSVPAIVVLVGAALRFSTHQESEDRKQVNHNATQQDSSISRKA